jgi:hypothetical protein
VAKKGSETIQVKVRMRRDEHRRVEREAEKRGLTINAEILRRHQGSFETESLVSQMAGGSGQNRWLLDLISRVLYALHGWESSTDDDRHRSLDAAVSLLIKGIRKGSITEADVGEARDAEGRGRLAAYSAFNRTVGKERI